MHYHFTGTELKTLAASLTVLHDTREQENGHILAWLDGHGVKHRQRSLPTGDYGIMMPAIPELGLYRDIYFDAAVERKNGVDELVETVKDRTRFENELIRGQQLGFFAIVVEDQAGFEKVVNGNYRSQYDAKALQASLAALSLRYGCPIHYLPAALSARWIWLHLYYFAVGCLRKNV